jgi:rhodanese-related sulfurtransferase
MNLEQKEWWMQFSNNENAIILDVRTEDEVNRGKIPGAINIDIYKGQGFIYSVDALDKSKEYFLYCAAGIRSFNACRIMEELGFEHTFNLLGGFSNWDGEVE